MGDASGGGDPLIFVIGGAFQGKLDYVRERLCDGDAQIWTCDETTLEIDWSCQVINKFHLLAWAHQQAGLDTLAYLEQHRKQLEEKIILCDDLSSGVVPIDKETRQ